jgi:hypothetical protein
VRDSFFLGVVMDKEEQDTGEHLLPVGWDMMTAYIQSGGKGK